MGAEDVGAEAEDVGIAVDGLLSPGSPHVARPLPYATTPLSIDGEEAPRQFNVSELRIRSGVNNSSLDW